MREGRHHEKNKFMSFDNRTIFAPATLVGSSGITVIRISGKDAFSLLAKIYSKSPNGFLPANPANFKTHTAHLGYIFNPLDGGFIDEAVITFFKAPNSYTGEDVAELSVHGGSFIFRKINSLLVSLGACHAEPGEFSKRAYLNGKMDLAQAEAVADLIAAKTEQANKLALKQLTGEFSKKIGGLKDDLINYCSLLELELDFSEEGIDLVSKGELLERIEKLINKFTELTATYESGKIIRNGVNLAIIGMPNVGKSSIFNYFLNENRAIVSEIPGTTRDFLQEPLVLGGVRFNIIDTAGIRNTIDIVEEEGVRRSKLKIDESDIVLVVDDLTANEADVNPQKVESITEIFIKDVPPEKILRIHNKLDLASGTQANGIRISAKTGEGMDDLKSEIIKIAKSLIHSDESSDIIITNSRHRDLLLKSCEYLVNAVTVIKEGGGNELISFEIRAAMDSISEIIGKTANVDILNNVFTKFCIGK